MQVELPGYEEMIEWTEEIVGRLNFNPDTRHLFILGIDALYVKLGGESIVRIK